MAKVAITEQYLEDIADAIRSKTGMSSTTYFPSEMAPAILTISGSGGITPTGTISITNNGTHNVTQYASANVQVPNTYTSGDEGKVVSNGALVNQTSATYTINNTYDTTLINSVVVNVPTGSEINNQDKTVNPTTSQQSITADSGYSGLGTVTVTAMPTLTLPTSTAAAATSGYTSKATIGRSTSDQYINIGTGYNTAGAYYKISAVANGSATAPASISGTSASVSTGTNTLTLSKTVSVTPSVSAGYISSGTAGNSSVSLTANVTTKAAATYHPSTSDQTISASQYLTGAQTVKAVTMTNLTAANIKKDVVIKIGDSTDDDCVATITGTYEGSGGGGSGGSSLQVATATTTLSNTQHYIEFQNLLGTPTSFIVTAHSTLATGASPYKIASVLYDGSNTVGQLITNTSNAQVSYESSNFAYFYNYNTLNISYSGSAYFQNIQYDLIYTYGGDSIDTKDVQVGSGATSITFTGLDDEPVYFSCVFKSNFSTSNGYQRVITVANNGDDTYGLEMDSSAKYSNAHWSYTYNNGSLTISSSGTNAGGYFHQPGYYQLTYATAGSGGSGGTINLQEKTNINPTTSSQTITADSGYDGLSSVQINAMPSGTAGTPTATKGTVSNHSISVTPSVTNTTGYITGGTKTGTAVSVSASELVSGNKAIGANGSNIDVTNYATVSVSVSGDVPTIDTLSVTPSETEQTFNSSSVDGYKPVTVGAISSTYVGSGITRRSSSDLTASGATVSVPAGYYSAAASKSVATGSATAPSTISGTSATVSTGTNTLTLTKTISVTPTVSAGYVSSGTAGNSSVSLTASVTTKAAATYHPSTTAQSIAASTYLTGAQTIAAVTTTNLSASNIVSGVTIKVGDSSDDDCVASVTGNVVLQNYYTGSSAPASGTGSNGDLYLQT